MYLLPIITEIQFNLVDSPENIHTRKAVFRARLDGDIAWIDMLQGKDFFKYIQYNSKEFCQHFEKYNIKTLEANVSDLTLEILTKILKEKNIEVQNVGKNYINNTKVNHIKINLEGKLAGC